LFTGIVERSARIVEIATNASGVRLSVSPRALSSIDGELEPWTDLEAGESISVDGVCLTLLCGDGDLCFDVVEETLRRSVLGQRAAGSPVNLERALRVGDRLGGHYVTGHVDTIGTIRSIEGSGETLWVIEYEPDSDFRTIEKGSVTVDGVSLTVVSRAVGCFSVALIPHTLAVTSLGSRSVGDPINLEMDHFGRWVAELMSLQQGELS
jgi:riboflavin synthase